MLVKLTRGERFPERKSIATFFLTLIYYLHLDFKADVPSAEVQCFTICSDFLKKLDELRDSRLRCFVRPIYVRIELYFEELILVWSTNIISLKKHCNTQSTGLCQLKLWKLRSGNNKKYLDVIK